MPSVTSCLVIIQVFQRRKHMNESVSTEEEATATPKAERGLNGIAVASVT